MVADPTPLGLKGLECAKLLLKHAKVSGCFFLLLRREADEADNLLNPCFGEHKTTYCRIKVEYIYFFALV